MGKSKYEVAEHLYVDDFCKQFILVTNWISYSRTYVECLKPYEGLVFNLNDEGIIEDWRLHVLRGRELRLATETECDKILPQYLAKMDEFRKPGRRRKKK